MVDLVLPWCCKVSLKKKHYKLFGKAQFPEEGPFHARIVMGFPVGADPTPDPYHFRFFIPSLESHTTTTADKIMLKSEATIFWWSVPVGQTIRSIHSEM